MILRLWLDTWYHHPPPQLHSFYIGDHKIDGTLGDVVSWEQAIDDEAPIPIVYKRDHAYVRFVEEKFSEWERLGATVDEPIKDVAPSAAVAAEDAATRALLLPSGFRARSQVARGGGRRGSGGHRPRPRRARYAETKCKKKRGAFRTRPQILKIRDVPLSPLCTEPKGTGSGFRVGKSGVLRTSQRDDFPCQHIYLLRYSMIIT